MKTVYLKQPSIREITDIVFPSLALKSIIQELRNPLVRDVWWNSLPIRHQIKDQLDSHQNLK